MSRSSREYLQHMLDETEYVLGHVQGLSKAAFLQNETLKRAFVRSLEIIGEAAKHIPDDLRQQATRIEWRAITGMRDRLIHAYFSVDYEIVWDAIHHNLPELQREIIILLGQEQT